MVRLAGLRELRIENLTHDAPAIYAIARLSNSVQISQKRKPFECFGTGNEQQQQQHSLVALSAAAAAAAAAAAGHFKLNGLCVACGP
jgi:hypothetical protein